MGITKRAKVYSSNPADYNMSVVETQLYTDRVVRIEKRVETRNWSDTLDYSDYRTTDCTYALVWLGTFGVPPRNLTNGLRPTVSLLEGEQGWGSDQPRALEFFEQFAWIDCTNLNADLMVYTLTASEDRAYATYGEPLMWANLIAYEAYQKAAANARAKVAADAELERNRLLAVEAAKKALREAKKEAKASASKLQAEADMVLIPTNGTVITVKGFTGQVFWKKVTQYRGTWGARFGLKDKAGTVAWFTAADLK